MDPSTSNVVLLSMVTMLQAEVDAAERRTRKLESLQEAQCAVIRSLRADLTDRDQTIQRISAGSEVLTRGLDAMYAYAKYMHEDGMMSSEDWNEFYCFMLRADVGFAILNGTNFVDLTADETLDGDETETEGEEDMEVEVEVHHEIEIDVVWNQSV